MGEFLLHTCSHFTCPESAGNPQAPGPPLQPPGPSQASWQPAASFSGLPIKLMVMTSRSQAVTSQRNNSDDRGDHTDPGPAPLEGVCAPSQLHASPQFQSLQHTAEVMEAQSQTVTCPGPPSWQGLPQHAPLGPEPTLPPPPGLGGGANVGTVFAHGLPTCVTLKFWYLSCMTQPTSHVFRCHVPPLAKQLMLHNQPISAETLAPNILRCATPARASSKPNKKGSSLLLAPQPAYLLPLLFAINTWKLALFKTVPD